MLQFSNNLIQVKKVAAEWEKEKAKEYKKYLKDVEAMIQDIFYQNSSGIFNDEEGEWLKELEGKKKVLMELEETKWRLKIHVLSGWPRETIIQSFFKNMLPTEGTLTIFGS
jgi:hypothetical protein